MTDLPVVDVDAETWRLVTDTLVHLPADVLWKAGFTYDDECDPYSLRRRTDDSRSHPWGFVVRHQGQLMAVNLEGYRYARYKSWLRAVTIKDD